MNYLAYLETSAFRYVRNVIQFLIVLIILMRLPVSFVADVIGKLEV